MSDGHLPCPDCEDGYCTETERLGSPDVGSGRRVLCTTCRGENTRRCDVCLDGEAVAMLGTDAVCARCLDEFGRASTQRPEAARADRNCFCPEVA